MEWILYAVVILGSVAAVTLLLAFDEVFLGGHLLKDVVPALLALWLAWRLLCWAETHWEKHDGSVHREDEHR